MALARLDVEGHVPVPGLLVGLGGRIALALEGVDMDDHRMPDAVDLLEDGDERLAVVAIGHVAVVEAHGAEEVVPSLAPGAAQLGKPPVEAAVVLGDGHLVVVDHHDEVAAQLGRSVESLEGLPARERAVADDGNDVLRATHDVTGLGQAQSQAHRGRGVPHLEEVVVRLVRIAVGRDVVVVLGREERLLAARQHLVGVGLVGHVEDEAVSRGVEDRVEGYRRLDKAEVGTEVPSMGACLGQQRIADLLSEDASSLGAKALEVGRPVNLL